MAQRTRSGTDTLDGFERLEHVGPGGDVRGSSGTRSFSTWGVERQWLAGYGPAAHRVRFLLRVRPAQVPHPGRVRDDLEPPLQRVHVIGRQRPDHDRAPRAVQRVPGDLVRLGRDHHLHQLVQGSGRGVRKLRFALPDHLRPIAERAVRVRAALRDHVGVEVRAQALDHRAVRPVLSGSVRELNDGKPATHPPDGSRCLPGQAIRRLSPRHRARQTMRGNERLNSVTRLPIPLRIPCRLASGKRRPCSPAACQVIWRWAVRLFGRGAARWPRLASLLARRRR